MESCKSEESSRKRENEVASDSFTAILNAHKQWGHSQKSAEGSMIQKHYIQPSYSSNIRVINKSSQAFKHSWTTTPKNLSGTIYFSINSSQEKYKKIQKEWRSHGKGFMAGTKSFT